MTQETIIAIIMSTLAAFNLVPSPTLEADLRAIENPQEEIVLGGRHRFPVRLTSSERHGVYSRVDYLSRQATATANVLRGDKPTKEEAIDIREMFRLECSGVLVDGTGRDLSKDILLVMADALQAGC